MTDRYPYRHHGPAVHGSKLTDYLISEANMIEDIEQLRAENARLRELLSIAVEMTGEPECWYDHHGYCQAHNLEPKGECWVELSSAILSADPAPVGDAWQSIDNITPDAGHVLLLGSTRHDARTIFTGWIAQNGMIYGDAWGLDCKPTHWMPLPKPPAGENGND